MKSADETRWLRGLRAERLPDRYGNRAHLISGEKKPKLPIKITRSDEQQQRWKIIFRRRDGEKEYLSSNFEDKLGNKQPSRIPIKTGCKKTSEEKEDIYKKRKSANDQNPRGLRYCKFLSSRINSSAVCSDKENGFCLRNTRTFLLDSIKLAVGSGVCMMD